MIFPTGASRGVNFFLYSVSLAIYGIFAVISYPQALPLRWFVAIGFVLRVVALVQNPYTTDLYRFLSDGLHLLAGHNPYLSPPAVAQTDFYEIRSMYGMALWPYFVLGALLSKWFSQQPLLAFKLLAGILELALLLYYTKRGSRLWLVAMLWTSPLLIFENWHEGHLEMVALIPLLLSFEIFKRRGASTGALWLATLSAAVKLQGLLLLLWYRFFPRRNGEFPIQKLLRFDAVWLAFFVALNLALTPTLFFHATLPGSSSGLTMYWVSWQHSQPWLVLGDMVGLSQGITIRLLQLLLLGGCTALVFARLYRQIDAPALLAGWLGCFVFFFPVQHPWYYQLLLLYVMNFRRYQLLFFLLMTLVGWNYLSYTPALAGSVLPQLMAWGVPLSIVFAAKKIRGNWQPKGIGQ